MKTWTEPPKPARKAVAFQIIDSMTGGVWESTRGRHVFTSQLDAVTEYNSEGRGTLARQTRYSIRATELKLIK